MSVLERDGSAFDAEVAAGFVLQVIEPHLNGPAGDMPAIVYDAKSDAISVVCGQGTAPAGATIGHYRGLGLDLVPGSGLLATVIPGAFDAWMLMLRDWGTWDVAAVLAPAIHYAEAGHPVLPRVAETIAGLAPFLAAHWPSSAAPASPSIPCRPGERAGSPPRGAIRTAASPPPPRRGSCRPTSSDARFCPAVRDPS